MTESSTIAVGVDDTDSSRRALAWAAREAVRRGASLQVITAWSWDAVEGAPLAAVDPQALLSIADQTQRDAIAEVIGPMAAKPPVAREVVQCSAAEALVDASRHADLVVVGTHGRGPVRSLLLGSVSLSVIKHAACPVVVMPPVTGNGSAQQDLAARSR
jgi:nucleotide-binding universal stress UspA family protein